MHINSYSTIASHISIFLFSLIIVANEVSDLTENTAHFWTHTPYPSTQSFVMYYIAIDLGGGGGGGAKWGAVNSS